MRMRWFLGGFGLGCLVGGLAVWALVAAPDVGETGRSPELAASQPVVPDGSPQADVVGAHRAPAAGAEVSPAREAEGTAEAPAATRGEARVGRAAAPDPSAEPTPDPKDAPELQAEPGEWTFGPGDVRLGRGEVIQLDVRGSVAKISFSAKGWRPSSDTRTRDHVKSLLDQEGWRRPAPLQEGPSGAARLLAQCRAAAAEHVALGGDASADTALALLESAETGATATAIGLADRGKFAEILAAAAADPVSGAFRYAAALSIVERCPADADAARAVIALTHTDDIDLRGLAEALLSRLGRAGSDAAADRLLSGDFDEPDLVGLAPAAMAGPRRLEVLTALRDPMAILACCAALRGADFGSEDLAPVADRLPAILTPLFTSARAQDWIGFAADLLGEVRPDALPAIVRSSEVPLRARLAALAVALRVAGAPDAVLDVGRHVLASDDLPRDVLGSVVAELDDDGVRSPSFTGTLRDLAARSRDAWTREDARRTLQRSLPRESGELRILSAIYGADGKTVDVADALRARCALGRLVETSGNHLGGDPLRGTGKVLRVEYALGRRRHVQEVPEGQAFHLP